MIKLDIKSNLMNEAPPVSLHKRVDKNERHDAQESKEDKDKHGEKIEKTTWVKCTSFGKGAEFAANYLKKGMKVMVEGKLEIQKWSDANGVARESIAVIAENIEILESNKPNDGQENGNWNQPAPAAAKAEPVASEGDDLPF